MSDFYNPAIRADVPPSMHPDILTAHTAALDVPGTIGHDALAPARWALATMYKFYADTEEADKALQASAPPASISHGRAEGPLAVEGGGLRRRHGRELEFADAVAAAFERVMPDVERQLAHIKKLREELDKKLGDAIDYGRGHAGEGLALSGEIRRHVKSLKPGERVTFLNQAVEAGDQQTVGAVLSGPAYLSGLDADGYAVVRGLAAARWAAQESAQLAALDAVLENVAKGASACLLRMAKTQKVRETPTSRADARLAALAGR